jgi:hypothetical protein
MGECSKETRPAGKPKSKWQEAVWRDILKVYPRYRMGRWQPGGRVEEGDRGGHSTKMGRTAYKKKKKKKTRKN